MKDIKEQILTDLSKNPINKISIEKQVFTPSYMGKDLEGKEYNVPDTYLLHVVVYNDEEKVVEFDYGLDAKFVENEDEQGLVDAMIDSGRLT